MFIAWDTYLGFNFDFNVALNLLKYSFLMFSFIPSWRISPFSKTPRYLYPSSSIWIHHFPILLHCIPLRFPISQLKHHTYLYQTSNLCPSLQCQVFWQGYQVVYKWFNLLLPFRNEYPCFSHLKTSVEGISDKMKSESDKESLWNIPRLIFTPPRFVSPDINSCFPINYSWFEECNNVRW